MFSGCRKKGFSLDRMGRRKRRNRMKRFPGRGFALAKAPGCTMHACWWVDHLWRAVRL